MGGGGEELHAHMLLCPTPVTAHVRLGWSALLCVSVIRLGASCLRLDLLCLGSVSLSSASA